MDGKASLAADLNVIDCLSVVRVLDHFMENDDSLYGEMTLKLDESTIAKPHL